jgi:hypothetical protein
MSTFTERRNGLIKNVANKKSGDTTSDGQVRHANQAEQAPRRAKIHYDTANLTSDYTNFFNLSAIKEEIILTFGIDQNWEHSPEIHVIDLNTRIILNPLAAKRLSKILNQLVQEYEKRFQTAEKELLARASLEAEKATKH